MLAPPVQSSTIGISYESRKLAWRQRSKTRTHLNSPVAVNARHDPERLIGRDAPMVSRPTRKLHGHVHGVRRAVDHVLLVHGAVVPSGLERLRDEREIGCAQLV
jgi:hypothetical protein